MDNKQMVLAATAVAAVACALYVFNQQSKKAEAKQSNQTKPKTAKKQTEQQPGTSPKKKEDKTPKQVDRANLEVDYAIGEKVQVYGGTRGWIDGEITGPPKLTKGGTVIFEVRRATGRPDPNNTGKWGRNCGHYD
jgi:hypothetical protein